MPKTQISQTFFEPNVEGLGNAPFIRFWYTGQNFIAGDGVTPVTVGDGQNGFYIDHVCSISSNRLLMPAIDLWATTDGSPATSRFCGQLYTEQGAPTEYMLFGGSPGASGWQLPTIYGATITYDELARYNAAAYLLAPPPTYYTKEQTIAEILRLAAGQNYAGLNILGRTELSATPDSASDPIAVGINDTAFTGAVNSQLSSYTAVASDRNKLIVFGNSPARTLTLPQPGASFPNGWSTTAWKALGLGGLTVTPTSSTIDGTASITIRPGSSVKVVSDGTNWYSIRGESPQTEYYLSNYQSLDNAVSAIGATRATLVVDVLSTVGVNLTIPSTITLAFTNTGGIQPSNGVTVTIDKRSLPNCKSTPFKIFYNALAGQGSIVLNGGMVMPQWWGAVADGAADSSASIIAAIATGAKQIYLPAGTYLVSQAQMDAIQNVIQITTANVEIFGDGVGRTIIKLSSSITQTRTNTIIDFLGAKDCALHDLTMQGAPTAAGNFTLTAVASRFGSYRTHLYNLEFVDWNSAHATGASAISIANPYNQAEFSTTLGTTIASGTRTVTPGSMNGIYIGRVLSVGGTAEYVVVTDTTTTTFTAVFANAHNSADSVSMVDDAYQGATIENINIHDCYNSQGMVINSTSNILKNFSIRRVGNTSGNQHGVYVQAGNNVFTDFLIEGVGGYGVHQYLTAGGVTPASGNKYTNGYIIDARFVFMLLDTNDTFGSLNPYYPSGTPTSRYTEVTNIVFRNTKQTGNPTSSEQLKLISPVIFDHNVLEDIPIMLVKSPYSRVGTHNIIRRLWQTNVTEILAPIGSGSTSGDQETSMTALVGQSAYERASNATNRRGGNLELAAGTGRRLFTVSSNLAGAVTLTFNFYGVQFYYGGSQNAATETVTAISTTNFALGSDDSAAQLAITATNLANWINGSSSNISNAVKATAVDNVVYLTKGFGEITFSLSSNNASAISATNDPDGIVKFPVGGFALGKNAQAQITANQNNFTPTTNQAIQRWSTDASRNITGLLMAPAQVDGQIVVIVNIGLADIVLKHQDAASTAANRFYCSTAADITLTPKQAADVIYDTTNQYWLVYKRN